MIVGVDVSSRRVDLAWLENGKPCRWHQELAKGHLIDRLRSIDVRWPLVISGRTLMVPGEDVTDIAIEYPFGRGNAIAALMATVGVITRQAPPWARVAWPSSGELRAAIGAKNTKTSAHAEICDQFPGFHEERGQTGLLLRITNSGLLTGWNEHELDALVACIGWTRILEAQDA